MDINTCFATTETYHSIAYYAHLVPMALALFLAVYTVIQTKFSKLSVIFFAFVFGFSLWLLGDLVDWVSPDYHWVYFTWSWLDFINIVFFVMGAYFFATLAKGQASLTEKVIYGVLCLPGFLITATGHSNIEFNQPQCEAINSDLLTNYKLFAEFAASALMLYSLGSVWKQTETHKKIQLGAILLAMLLFFGVFGGTEYVASVSAIYEINLYGLFVLPLFLIVMTFAITDLRLFQMRFVGTHILAYILIITVSSQFIFITDSTSRNLSLITLAMSIFIGILLIENARREAQARIYTEELAKELQAKSDELVTANAELGKANERLKELDKAKDEFLSIATHQLKAPLSSIRGAAANLLDGSFGKVSAKLQQPIASVLEVATGMVRLIDDYLNISRIEQGRMKYELSDFDLTLIAKKVSDDLRANATKKGLELLFTGPEPLFVNADIGKITQVVTNLVDNAIKYTPKGHVTAVAEKFDKDGKAWARVAVKDSGIGIDPSEIGKLFHRFSRAADANKTNTQGTGLGLYVAKQLTEGCGGTIRIESEGLGKGSSFIIEFPIVQSQAK